MRQAIATTAAPKAIGPYSQAIKVGQLVFVSGQIAIDPATGDLVEGGVLAETHRVLTSIGEILRAAGVSFDAVARSTLYLANLDDFTAVNEVYAAYFGVPQPARATIEVSRLPKNARVEIDVIAVLE